MTKRLALLISILIAFSSTFCAQTAPTRVSVLGDSYSTYGGYCSPAWNLCWYNGSDMGRGRTDVNDVSQTWWYLLADDNDMVIEKNNSFSGSTICCTGYRKEDFSDRAFITRIYNLGDPDVILIFGGTNDSWAGAPIGEYQYSGWTKEQLYTFRPAFAFLLSEARRLYPEARIINITNSELKDDITESMQVICDHYGVPNVKLHDIEKISGHPSVKGMAEIARQVKPYIQ